MCALRSFTESSISCPAPQGCSSATRFSSPGSSFPFPSPPRCSAPGSSLVIHHVDGIDVGDFSEEKEPGACCHEDGNHRQRLEPFRQVRGKVESAGRKETEGKKGGAEDLPIKPIVIEPEGGPILKSDPDPVNLRVELIAAVLALPYQARPTLRPDPLPVLAGGALAVPIAAIGAIRDQKVRSHFVSFRSGSSSTPSGTCSFLLRAIVACSFVSR